MNKVTPTIYCDMDGVLVNFIAGAYATLHRPWDSYKTAELRAERNRKCFEAGAQWWEGLPPLPDYWHLWSYIQPYNPNILTAYPSGNFDAGERHASPTAIKYAKEGKWVWVQRHLHVPYERFHCVAREHKQEYATKAEHGHIISNILIDDTPQNIQEWINNRGIGILHHSASDTINKLKQHGIINPAVAA